MHEKEEEEEEEEGEGEKETGRNEGRRAVNNEGR